ncbi:LysR family transcriptional regulator [Desulfosporosinus sp. BICA1-9]|uniref:LysR family transcriptional regulator n=1 Tax=Desulfosporosinus sp. BICA1-9 TaxID=1531958 RepID=UPI00054C626F|nr:LysR family transcriptional regulator [Desulfosporosinus sp. BICA1-9]KJS48187.1 MAG: hypothetical protein VR66_15385 [Peptococcaceae bacterium BRH_c23]KJS87876.1 MAG: hypothetical protein JL57_13180 [Desulfosporosinus sp. BICA1-9]HBW37161.1 LysR family transcriptional regulator [Desulfosporosinus sp.]
MELHNLEAFLQVAKLQSFSKAAAMLHITQSTITIRVQSLEKELGQYLFIRTSRKVELSSSGSELLPYVEQALGILELGKQKLEADATSGIRKLNIAANHTINTHEIPRLVSIMNQKWPNIRINVITARSNSVIDKLLSGEVHIGLIRTPMPKFNLYCKRLFEEELVLVVTPNDPFANFDTVNIKDLNGIKMVAHATTSAFGRWMMNLFTSKGVYPDIISENDYYMAIKGMILEGVGVAILPLSSVRNEINQGSLKTIKILGAGKLVSSVIAACEKNKLNSPEISAFFSASETIERTGINSVWDKSSVNH